MRQRGESYFGSFYTTAILQKLTPPEFTSIASQVHPRYATMKLGAALRSFSPCLILPLGTLD